MYDFSFNEFMLIMIKAVPRFFGFDSADIYINFLKEHINMLTVSEIEAILEVYNGNPQCYNRAKHSEDIAEIQDYINQCKEQDV